MKKIPSNNFWFQYHNANSHNHKVGDCVIRALSTAIGIKWEEAYEECVRVGYKYGRMPNDPKVYSRVLEKYGFIKMPAPTHYITDISGNLRNARLTGREYVDHIRDLRINGLPIKSVFANIGAQHCTAIVKDNQYGIKFRIDDTWDCSTNKIGCIWVKLESK